MFFYDCNVLRCFFKKHVLDWEKLYHENSLGFSLLLLFEPEYIEFNVTAVNLKQQTSVIDNKQNYGIVLKTGCRLSKIWETLNF